MALLLPLLAGFLAPGAAGAFATLILIGAVTVSTFSVSVVLLFLPPIAFGLALTLPASESDARRRARLERMQSAVPDQT